MEENTRSPKSFMNGEGDGVGDYLGQPQSLLPYVEVCDVDGV